MENMGIFSDPFSGWGGHEYKKPNEDEKAIKSWWVKFYKNYFNITVDFTNVNIPNYEKGFDWPIFIAKGITVKQILDVMQKCFTVKIAQPEILYDLPDLTRDYQNDRNPVSSSYAIRWYIDVNNIVLERLKSCSYVTLIEALIIKLAAYENHFDLILEEKWFCWGSQGININRSPEVRWFKNVLYLGWCSGTGDVPRIIP